MKIDSIHLTNYRCHRALAVEFAPGFNAVVGINGSGKTSLLGGICEALSGFVNYSPSPYSRPPLQEANLARLEVTTENARVRFEPQYPVKIGAGGEIYGEGAVWTIHKESAISAVVSTGRPPGEIWQRLYGKHGMGLSELAQKLPLPVMAFYRANRHWNQPGGSEMQAATQKNSRYDGYASWWDASLDATTLQSWAVGKCLERFQTISETGRAFDTVEDDELALVNSALARVVEGVKGLRYDLKQKSLLVEWLPRADIPRDPTPFENLSDGQKAVIALVADIARRMCLLNPQLGGDVTDKTPGVVLIDELDVHLHPNWQHMLTSGLKAVFPAVQFIVATHAPQVLSELQPGEIILLRPEGTAHPQVSYGLDSSSVLEEIMGGSARPRLVEQALQTLFAALERDDLGAARSQLAALALRAPGLAELSRADALLKRKELIGR